MRRVGAPFPPRAPRSRPRVPPLRPPRSVAAAAPAQPPPPPPFRPGAAHREASAGAPELRLLLEAERSRSAALAAALAAARAGGGPEARPPHQHDLVLFTGGTGFNALCAALSEYTTRVAHVLPVSDDGGSTAEIVRVLGGPAVGDIRSRCLRLADDSTSEARAVRALLGHRLGCEPRAAEAEWHDVLVGRHRLWAGVGGPYRHTVTAFLAHFQSSVLRASAGLGPSAPPFCFAGGSVGNFFFAGARLYFGSLDAAIFLFSRVASIPPASAVLPAVATSGRLRLGAELESGVLLRGQSMISHPPGPTQQQQQQQQQQQHARDGGGGGRHRGGGGLHPAEAAGAAAAAAAAHRHPHPARRVDKGPGSAAYAPLAARVRRVLYLSSESAGAPGEWWSPPPSAQPSPSSSQQQPQPDAAPCGLLEVFPPANPAVLCRLATADAVVYTIGSLWSSICPSLVAVGVGEAVAALDAAKVLLLNGTRDRETTGMGVADCVRAITSSLNRAGGGGGPTLSPGLGHPPGAFVTAVLCPAGGEFDAAAAADELRAMGVPEARAVASDLDPAGRVVFNPAAVVHALRSITDAHRARRADRVGYSI